VFMLVDLKGSTALADRLGDERAHALITSVFFDIDQPIQEHGGEIYSYVGDGLIVTWPLAEGIADARCLRCHLAIGAVLEAKASAYRREFGVVPSVRVALHAGPVVAGECGDTKLSIVYLGDTLNAAARIEQTAKDLDRDCLVSEPLMQRLRVPPSLQVERLGPVGLRGRRQPMDLFALGLDPAAQRGARPSAREEACAISPG
jgi:adenylate cyclase